MIQIPSPALPRNFLTADRDQSKFNGSLTVALTNYLTNLATRTNGTLPKDGSEAFTGSLAVSGDIAAGNATFATLTVVGTSLLTGVVTGGALLDLSAAGASQIKFGNANNSANTATLDGYTDWIASTPTVVGCGIVTGLSYFSKRIGDKLEVYCKFTTGTPTAVEMRVPLLLNGVALTSDATKIPAIRHVGTALRGTAAAVTWYPLLESGVTYFTFGFQAAGTSGLTKQLGNAILGVGETFEFNAFAPISGW